jgi:hypothetical protein
MVQNYHDGMAISRVRGAPDLFITFTCNPKWQEISDALALEPGQSASDRPDIVTRVFNMKYNEFLASVKDGSLFGPIKACKGLRTTLTFSFFLGHVCFVYFAWAILYCLCFVSFLIL